MTGHGAGLGYDDVHPEDIPANASAPKPKSGDAVDSRDEPGVVPVCQPMPQKCEFGPKAEAEEEADAKPGLVLKLAGGNWTGAEG